MYIYIGLLGYYYIYTFIIMHNYIGPLNNYNNNN